MRILERPSPNQDERPADTPVDTLILHYTGMQTGEAAMERLCDPASRVSSHYVVEENGMIWQLVDEGARAWHAGISYWRGQTALNDRSIGIEIVNPGHEWGYREFPKQQMTALRGLCKAILADYPILPRNVVGHSDVAPDRKQDPGELFDWAWLAEAGIGLWPTAAADAVPDDVEHVGTALAEIGYPPGDREVVLRAFQRHWLPDGVTGLPDGATRARLAEVHAAIA